MPRMMSLTEVRQLVEAAINEADAEIWMRVKLGELEVIPQANALETVHKYLRALLDGVENDGDINAA
jgi:hypothetical protein